MDKKNGYCCPLIWIEVARVSQCLPNETNMRIYVAIGDLNLFQVENEYASFDTIDKAYLEFIQESYLSHGVDSLLFTSDGSYNGEKGSLPGLLKTANFQFNPESNLNDLLKFQPDKPPMVMEFWSGNKIARNFLQGIVCKFLVSFRLV